MACDPGPAPASPTATPTPPAVTSSTRTPPATTMPQARANPGGLTDAQMVGQLFVPYVYGSGPTAATSAQRAANIALYGEPTPAAIVRRWHVGGLILLD